MGGLVEFSAQKHYNSKHLQRFKTRHINLPLVTRFVQSVKAQAGWRKEEEESKRTIKHDHHFQVRHFNNVFDQSWCHCIVGATPASRSNCLQTRRIYHQVKYQRLNANTCIVAAILFSGHPYIGRHYRAP